MTPEQIAKHHAMRAFADDFEMKFDTRAVHELSPARLCFFNNNPYNRNLLIRDRQTEEFLRRLAQIGITKLGYAEYPSSGPCEGYSYAVILDAPPKMGKRVMEIWRDVFVHFGWEDAGDDELRPSD